MRVITIPIIKNSECKVALTTALDLAKKLSANVHGYHLLPSVDKEVIGSKSNLFNLVNPSERYKLLNKSEIELRRKNSYSFFEGLVEQKDFKLVRKPRYQSDGGQASFTEIHGSPEKVFSIIGPLSDLIVVSRPEKKSSFHARAYMLSALLYSGQAVLVLPQKKTPVIGNRILLSWNQSIEAVSAIKSVIPLLQKAESVHVVCSGSEYRTGPKLKHLKQYLKQWNINVQHTLTKGASVEKEIIKTYKDTKSDLLVMGAYSRNQWREKLFGGVTNYMLNDTKLPVLMLHR